MKPGSIFACATVFCALAGPAAARPCTSDDMPAAERKKLESDYTARRLLQGQPKADAWARAEGIKYRARMDAAGGCGTSSTKATPARPGDKKKCRMVSRPIAGPSGMTMAMVPKCD